ncbi:hypothetical protein CRYUN_Cryun38cG0026100 [Craigia yunnanensis]
MENLGVKLDDSKIDSLIGKKTVNMNFYPTCPNPELTVGVGRHSDMGTLTVLLQDGIGGLYVNIPEDANIEFDDGVSKDQSFTNIYTRPLNRILFTSLYKQQCNNRDYV